MKAFNWESSLCLLVSIITLTMLIGEPLVIRADAATGKITTMDLKDLKTETGAGVHLVKTASGQMQKFSSKITAKANSAITFS